MTHAHQLVCPQAGVNCRVYLLLAAKVLLYMKFRKIEKRNEKSRFDTGGG